MTDEELTAIELRAAAAYAWTPGLIAEQLTAGVYDVPAIESREEFLEATQNMLAAALNSQTDIPALVEEVRRLQEENKKLRGGKNNDPSN
jgi:hypothetical protein